MNAFRLRRRPSASWCASAPAPASKLRGSTRPAWRTKCEVADTQSTDHQAKIPLVLVGHIDAALDLKCAGTVCCEKPRTMYLMQDLLGRIGPPTDIQCNNDGGPRSRGRYADLADMYGAGAGVWRANCDTCYRCALLSGGMSPPAGAGRERQTQRRRGSDGYCCLRPRRTQNDSSVRARPQHGTRSEREPSRGRDQPPQR